MSKRKAQLESGSDDDESESHTSRKRTARSRPIRPPLYKASVKELADVGEVQSNCTTADIPDAVIHRIKSCLARGKHPTTPEAEAKIAVHLASKLMGQYSISQAEVFKHAPPSVQSQYAGRSLVSIKRTDCDGSKPIRQQAYVSTLAHAMNNFFDCKHYSVASSSFLEYTFYGIATNTAGAAMSFEMAYNFIAEWARRYKGTASMNSYCHGAADELWKTADEKQKSEENEAMKAESDAIKAKEKEEEAERRERLDRLASLPALSDRDDSEDEDCDDASSQPNHHVTETGNDGDDCDDCGDSDEPDFGVNDGDDVNPYENFEDEMKKFAKPVRQLPDTSPEPADETEKVMSDAGTGTISTWTSRQDLVTFRNSAANIADGWAKDKGLKILKGRTKKTEIRDWKAYKEGVEDGKKIDVHRRRVEESRDPAH